jgi:hypothetical protein
MDFATEPINLTVLLTALFVPDSSSERKRFAGETLAGGVSDAGA